MKATLIITRTLLSLALSTSFLSAESVIPQPELYAPAELEQISQAAQKHQQAENLYTHGMENWLTVGLAERDYYLACLKPLLEQEPLDQARNAEHMKTLQDKILQVGDKIISLTQQRIKTGNIDPRGELKTQIDILRSNIQDLSLDEQQVQDYSQELKLACDSYLAQFKHMQGKAASTLLDAQEAAAFVEEADTNQEIGTAYFDDESKSIHFAALPQSTHQAAAKGDAEAQFQLAMLYLKDSRNNRMEEGIAWLELAAEQKHTQALCNLGGFYLMGHVVEQDAAKGLPYLEQAAKQGDTFAMYNIALCYQQGLGTEKNEAKMLHYFQQAADLGDMLAQFQVALCHEQGIATPKDLKQAAYWYDKAAQQGDEEAAEARDAILNTINKEQQ